MNIRETDYEDVNYVDATENIAQWWDGSGSLYVS